MPDKPNTCPTCGDRIFHAAEFRCSCTGCQCQTDKPKTLAEQSGHNPIDIEEFRRMVHDSICDNPVDWSGWVAHHHAEILRALEYVEQQYTGPSATAEVINQQSKRIAELEATIRKLREGLRDALGIYPRHTPTWEKHFKRLDGLYRQTDPEKP